MHAGKIGIPAAMAVLVSFTAAHAASLVMTSGLSLNRNPPFNLIVNGSFEDGPGEPTAATPFKYWATGTSLTPFAVPPGWTSVGGPASYASWSYDTTGPYTWGSAVLPHGNRGMYTGNFYVSSISQTPTFNPVTGLVTFPNPATLTITPHDASYAPYVRLSQTVTGLNTNAVYKFSFWTSGEGARFGSWGHDGIFALDVTGFNTIYLAAPSGAPGGVGASKRYDFYLQPANSTTTFSWTNWGHFSSQTTAGWPSHIPYTDELVLDDVILNFDYIIPEPATLALLGIGGLMTLRRSRR